jgi:hypothetical protein
VFADELSVGMSEITERLKRFEQKEAKETQA